MKPKRMQACAIGIRVHSGWGALVAVAVQGKAIDVLDRKRVEIIERAAPGGAQPYHFAKDLELRAAAKFISDCKVASTQMALAGLREVVDGLNGRGYRTAGLAILLSSGRPLPELGKILASHPTIHTAEGEFFRECFGDSGASLKLPVIGIVERDIGERAHAALGKLAASAVKTIAALGRELGPPWTNDQKTAALAAAIVLAELSA